MVKLVVAILGILFFVAIEQISVKTHKNGTFLKFPISLYYEKIKTIISPYYGLKGIDDLLESAQNTLKHIQNEYNSYKTFNNLEIGSIYQILMEEYNNRVIVESFVLIYIYQYKFQNSYSVWPSDEEKHALTSLREYCRDKLLLLKNDIPDCFWSEFELNPNTLESKIYWSR